MRPLRFVGSALKDLQGFSIAPRRAAGFELLAIQRGLLTLDWNLRRHAPQTLPWRRGVLGKSKVKHEERTGDQMKR